MKRISNALAIMMLAAISMAAGAQSRDEASAELKDVRQRIDMLTKDIEKEGRRRSKAEQALANIEKAEQQARRDLATVRAELKSSQTRQAELERQSGERKSELDEQRKLLAEQLRVAYINGNEEWLRVALSQQDAAGLGRRMTYYSYLSRQRGETIANVVAAVAELQEIQQELSEEIAQLADLESQAATKLEEIAANRAERADLLSQINAGILSKDAEIDRLQAQAAELTELVKALARVLPQMPDLNAEPFAGKAASLSWPATGPIRKNFGDSRADGRLKWQGVLIGGAAGNVVQTVYHGRVVFSDWLDGMGLLMIVDHGGGYMSLYGHNQDLLKEVGDWVSPGEPIAHIGDSGGQNAAGLYFEIRKDGKPVNPRRWIK